MMLSSPLVQKETHPLSCILLDGKCIYSCDWAQKTWACDDMAEWSIEQGLYPTKPSSV